MRHVCTWPSSHFDHSLRMCDRFRDALRAMETELRVQLNEIDALVDAAPDGTGLAATARHAMLHRVAVNAVEMSHAIAVDAEEGRYDPGPRKMHRRTTDVDKSQGVVWTF